MQPCDFQIFTGIDRQRRRRNHIARAVVCWLASVKALSCIILRTHRLLVLSRFGVAVLAFETGILPYDKSAEI